ncbi:MAG: hypothetical protein ACOYNL_09130 [Rickettsiales bacterium]
MEAFIALVRSASEQYRGIISHAAISPEAYTHAKDKLRSAIVAGQFDSGPASIVILDATRSKGASLGVGS